MKNHLWNMFANIKNGQVIKRPYVLQHRKTICERYLQVMWDEGYINGYSNEPDGKIKIFLKYLNGHPAIKDIKTISKPGHRIYYTKTQIWKIDSNKHFIIFSTSKGVMSLIDCKKNNIGGEPVIKIS